MTGNASSLCKKVGMSREEVKVHCIHSQVMQVFFPCPCLQRASHIVVVFPLAATSRPCWPDPTACCFPFARWGRSSVFAVLYMLVYMLTARVYYKIVSLNPLTRQSFQ